MASVSQPVANQTAPQIESFAPDSSWIALLEYDQTNLTLTTHLKSGAIYQHKMFFPLSWEDLKNAQDHAQHWARNVRGKHLSVRLKSAKAPKSELKHKGR